MHSTKSSKNLAGLGIYLYEALEIRRIGDLSRSSTKSKQKPTLKVDLELYKAATGSDNLELGTLLIKQVTAANWLPDWMSKEELINTAQASLAMLKGIKPQDEFEGMLAAQMVATHNTALECFRRAMLPDQTVQGRDNNLKNAAKLSGLFTRQMEALNKHRGKGQQKVTVEHVHVAPGGQAIVGTVETGNASGLTTVKERKEINSVAHTKEKDVAPKTRGRKKVKQPRIHS